MPFEGVVAKKIGSDVFSRVIYTENHDQVGHPPGQSRLPALIDTNNNESVFAKKRSTLAAAIMLTSPGIPMIFQGQEMLETRAFGFTTPTNMNFSRVGRSKRQRDRSTVSRLDCLEAQSQRDDCGPDGTEFEHLPRRQRE